MTELSFLIDLLLNHKLPKATQAAIKERIDNVQNAQPQLLSAQSQPRLAPTFSIKPASQEPAAVPIEQVAQNPTTQAAIAHRQAMIDAAANRKVMPGTTGAPKVHGNL